MKRALLFLLIAALVLPIISACGAENDGISVYFKDAHLSTLNEEKRTVEEDMSTKDIAIFAVNELIKGPENETNVAVISNKAKLLNLEIVNKVVTVNLSKHYLDKKGTDGILLQQALTCTLCSIEGIDKVAIQVEGQPIVDADGKEIPPVSKTDYIDPQSTQTVDMKLYFPNSKGTMLGSEIREVEIQNTPSLEKAVVNELIKGPTNKSLSKVVPEGTKLLGIETKDKICYVNFSSEFLNSAKSSSSLETTLILYSIVNSLCELKNVDSVQILVDGNTGTVMGDLVFDTDYPADKSYVE